MTQTSTGFGTTASTAHSIPSLLPSWLRTAFLPREVDPRQASTVETTKSLQRDALRHLLAGQPASGLGDYLELGVSDRTSVRCMSQVLRELRLPDVRVLAFASNLTPELRQKHWLRKASVVRIGRDLQASPADVLRSVEPLILEQAVIILEREEQEAAFAEFLRAHPGFTSRRLPSNSTMAQSFVVTRGMTV